MIIDSHRACTNTVTVHVGHFARPKSPEGNPVCSLTYYTLLCDDVTVIAVEVALLMIGQYLQLSFAASYPGHV